MATATQRGKAVVEGVRGTIDLVVYPVAQSAKVTHEWDEEIVHDQGGFAAAWLARDMRKLADWAFKALGDTAAHAKTGLAFIAPLATVTLSGFDTAELNS